MKNPALTTAWQRELAKAAGYTRPKYPESQGRLAGERCMDRRRRLRRRIPLRRCSAGGAGSLDTHDTLYIGTFSKTLFPAVRMGFMVLPKVLREPFRIAKRISTFGCPAIEQRALAQFIENRGFDRHLRRAAQTLRVRRGGRARLAGRHAPGRVAARLRRG